MKKMRLDDLCVESFTTEDEPSLLKGTVHGRENTEAFCKLTDDDYSCWASCPATQAPAATCYYTCENYGTACNLTEITKRAGWDCLPAPS